MNTTTNNATVATTYVIGDRRIDGKRLQNEYGSKEAAQRDCDVANRWEDRQMPNGDMRYFVTAK